MSSLWAALPKNKPGRISIGSPP
jgi:hypothetical protein